MTSIIFHTRGPTLKKIPVTYLNIMFQLMFIFRILRAWKATFSHLSISLYELCTKEFRVFGGH